MRSIGRLLLVLTLFILLPVAVSARQVEIHGANEFKVTSPNGLEVEPGGWVDVKWNTVKISKYARVKMELYTADKGKNLGRIHRHADVLIDNKGTYEYAIGNDIYKVNFSYRIRVSTPDGKYFGWSGIFRVIPVGTSSNQVQVQGAPDIKVLHPASGETFKPGAWVTVEWDKARIAKFPKVKLELFTADGAKRLGPIHRHAAALIDNKGTYEYAIGNDIYQIDNTYKIRVSSPDGRNTGWSGVFRIAPFRRVPETATLKSTGRTLFFYKTRSTWGAMNTMGTGFKEKPGYLAVGYDNYNHDPAGPGWAYTGYVYRAAVNFFNEDELKLGTIIEKAELHFRMGSYQSLSAPIHVMFCETDSGDLNAPLTLIETVPNAGSRREITVDVTPYIQAWCKGDKLNHGFIIKGANENFDHNNEGGKYEITYPELVLRIIRLK